MSDRWQLTNGSCLEPVTGLASLAEKSVAHVITDPPYEAEAHTKGRRTKRHAGGGIYLPREESVSRGFAAITEEERDAVSQAIGRVVSRWVLVFCQVEAVQRWATALVNGSLTYKRSCVWIKPDGQPQLTGDRPGMGYETIVTAHTPGRSRWNAGGKLGVYTAMKNQDHGPPHLRHPTVKPLALMEALIRDFTDPDDLICDPYAGSGTTGVAALRLGRRFIGWEVDPAYFALACKRLTDTREQPELAALEAFERSASGKRKQVTLELDEPFKPGDE